MIKQRPLGRGSFRCLCLQKFLTKPFLNDPEEDRQVVSVAAQLFDERKNGFGIHGTFRVGRGGRAWEIRPYLRILNALDRRDALFYAFQPWRSDELTPLAARPLVPVVGVAWRF